MVLLITRLNVPANRPIISSTYYIEISREREVRQRYTNISYRVVKILKAIYKLFTDIDSARHCRGFVLRGIIYIYLSLSAGNCRTSVAFINKRRGRKIRIRVTRLREATTPLTKKCRSFIFTTITKRRRVFSSSTVVINHDRKPSYRRQRGN